MLDQKAQSAAAVSGAQKVCLIFGILSCYVVKCFQQAKLNAQHLIGSVKLKDLIEAVSETASEPEVL